MQERPTGLETQSMQGRQGPLAFFLVYIVAGVGLLVAQRGGCYVLAAPIVLTFVVIPVFDALIGVDTRNPPESPPTGLSLLGFRLAAWLAVPVQAAVLSWGLWSVTRPSVSAIELVGYIVAVGITGGVIGITVAHELIHRPGRVDRWLGGALLVMVSYLHWAIEHVSGHHRRVATLEDPATARLGESLPAFILRSVTHGFVSAWRIEAARNQRRGIGSPLRNRVLPGVIASCALAGGLGLGLGPRAVLFFLAQSAIAIGFLETVNYIEHYGLERRELKPGVYERVTPLHSWNAAHWLTNAVLFNLQRHSDHHAVAARPYYQLRHHHEAPQLPTGYAGMALLALFPPLFWRVMNPRVAAHRARVGAPI